MGKNASRMKKLGRKAIKHKTPSCPFLPAHESISPVPLQDEKKIPSLASPGKNSKEIETETGNDEKKPTAKDAVIYVHIDSMNP